MRFFKRFALLAFVLALGFFAFIRFMSVPPDEPSSEPSKPVVAVPPVLFESMGQGAVAPTGEELEDEQHYFDEQVQKAGIDLNDPAVEARMNGVEQLAAYPTFEAEQLLVRTLTTDFDAEVRAQAAQSLRAIVQPGDKTIDALLMMLEDSDKKVQLSSLDALVNLIERSDAQSARYKKLVAALKKKTASKKLAPLTRKAIQEYLSEL